MVKFNRILISLAALPLAFAAAPSGAVVFQTNFDSVVVPAGGYVILPTVEGWTATAGAGIEVQNHAAGSPYSETNLVELDSDDNSSMSRSIGPGSYILDFFYSPRPGIPASSNGISVFLDSLFIFNVTGAGSGGTVWSPQQLNFTTTNALSTLTFTATGTSDSLGGYLDNISLTAAVPEPSTWAMMLLGFGVIGLSMRRRRKATSFAHAA